MEVINRYQFDQFVVDCSQRYLKNSDGELISVPARAFDLLVYFLQNPGKPLSHGHLLETIWQDRVVGENSLRKAVASLRAVLGDDVILTVPGQGYQFVCAVNSTPLAEQVVNHDSTISSKNIPANNARKNNDASKKSIVTPLRMAWSAATIVVLVTALWFVTQSNSDSNLSPQVEDPSAALVEQLIQQGNTFRSNTFAPLALEAAIGRYKRVLRIDPNNAEAQIQLATTLGQVASLQTDQDKLEVILEEYRPALLRAKMMAQDTPHMTAFLAEELMNTRLLTDTETFLSDWMTSTNHDDVQALLSYGIFLRRVGFPGEALKYLEQAYKKQPQDIAVLRMLSWTLTDLGQTQKAIEMYEVARQSVGYSPLNVNPLSWLLLSQGQFDEARNLSIDLMIEFKGIDRTTATGYVFSKDRPLDDMNMFDRLWAVSYSNLENPQQGLQYLKETIDHPEVDSQADIFHYAMFAALFGDTELSFKAIHKLHPNEEAILNIIWIPLMSEVRQQPEFVDLLLEIGLIEYWDSTQWPDYCEKINNNKIQCI